MPKIDPTEKPVNTTTNKPVALASLDDFRPSDDYALTASRITLHAPPGTGKTVTACSIDPSFPDVLPAEKTVDLDQIAYFGFDDNALEGVFDLNLNVPLSWSLSEWMWDGGYKEARNPNTGESTAKFNRDITQAMTHVVNLAYTAVREAGVTACVFDSMSWADKLMRAKFAEMEAAGRFKTPKGKIDPFAKWNAQLNAHTKFYRALSPLPCHLIFVCHSQADNEEDTAKKRASKIPGIYDITPAITGKAIEVYTGNVSMEAVPGISVDPKTKKETYTLMPKGGKQFRGKCRWKHALNDVEPANLTKLIAKVKASRDNQEKSK
jgi:hypothetical protein